MADLSTALNPKEDQLLKSADSAGLASAPTLSSVAATLPDVTPDVAKMAGSAQQKRRAQLDAQRAAAKTGLQGGPQTLTQTKRYEHASDQKTEQQRQASEMAAKMRQLGSTGVRVEQLMQRMWSDAATQAPASAPIASDALSVTDRWAELADQPAKQQEAEDALTQFIQSTREGNELEANEQLLTLSQLGFGVGPEDLRNLAGEIEDATGRSVADTLADTITLSQFAPEDLQALGFTGLDELGTTLGASAAEVADWTPAQLRQRVADIQAEEYQKTASLRRRLNDPMTSPAEREQIVNQLRQMSAAGVTGVEAEVESLKEAMAAETTVEIAGREYTIAELLDDDEIELITTKYLQAEPEEQARMREEQPNLFNFIDSHAELFRSTLSDLTSQAGEFADVQTSNRETASTFGLDPTNPDHAAFLDALVPGWSEGSATDVTEQLGDTQLFQVLSKPEDWAKSLGLEPAEIKSNLQSKLTELANTARDSDPEVYAELLDLGPEELRDLGFFAPGGLGTEVKQYLADRALMRQFESGELNIDEAVSELFGAESDELVSSFKKLDRARRNGPYITVLSPEQREQLRQSWALLRPLASDGVINADDLGRLQELAESRMPDSLADVLDQGTLSSLTSGAPSVPDPWADKPWATPGIKAAVAKGRVIPRQELSKLDLDGKEAVLQSGLVLPYGARRSLQRQVNSGRAQEAIAEAGLPEGLNLKQFYNQPQNPEALSPAQLAEYITNTKAVMSAMLRAKPKTPGQKEMIEDWRLELAQRLGEAEQAQSQEQTYTPAQYSPKEARKAVLKAAVRRAANPTAAAAHVNAIFKYRDVLAQGTQAVLDNLGSVNGPKILKIFNDLDPKLQEWLVHEYR